MAEALITLGIIGVVASMTLPDLIAKHEKKVIATRVKSTYSTLFQLVKLSEAYNGEIQYWNLELSGKYNFTNTELVLKKYILPYLNGYTFCGNGKVADTQKKCGLASFSAGQTYFLKNGVALSIMPISARQDVALNLEIDVNGLKQPNRFGYDQFQFYISRENGKVYPIKEVEGLTREEILAGKNVMIDNDMHYVACKKSKSSDDDIYYRHGCTALLMMDGWEFKSDYPW